MNALSGVVRDLEEVHGESRFCFRAIGWPETHVESWNGAEWTTSPAPAEATA